MRDDRPIESLHDLSPKSGDWLRDPSAIRGVRGSSSHFLPLGSSGSRCLTNYRHQLVEYPIITFGKDSEGIGAMTHSLTNLLRNLFCLSPILPV